MISKWLQTAAIRAASVLAPADERSEWLEWWRSEFWYVPPGEATRFCFGAFQDALWVKRNSLPSGKRITLLCSPFVCLVALGNLSAASIWIASRMEGMLPFHAVDRTSAAAGIADLFILYLILAVIAFIVRDSPGSGRPLPCLNLRSWVFLGCKILLVLPILQCTMVAVVVVNLPPLSIVFFAGCVLLFRWVFGDQLRRCPVCLRLLSKTVRVGSPSRTFLSRYGDESMCACGHGSLFSPGPSASYSRDRKWIDLDDSWRALQSEAAELR